MQLRALDAVARRGIGGPSLLAPWPTTGRPDAAALGGLLAGLADLRAAVPRGLTVHDGPVEVPAVGVPGAVPAGEVECRWFARSALAEAADLVAAIGEAARRAAAGLAACGHEPAADVADVLMTVALALRILAELERSAIPAG
jgi:hypothetical protein